MRYFKVFLSCIVCIGLLGGVGYGIYTAILNQGSHVSLYVEGEFFDITDFAKDYDRVAEGTVIQLPSTNEALTAKGISKKGHNFGGWYYDANYTRPVEGNKITKVKGLINLYLKWVAKDFKVYTIQLKDDYAENFDFKGFGDEENYKKIANIKDAEGFAPNIISYENSVVLTDKPSAQIGYEYVWIKWIGEGEYETDENGVPIYYFDTYKVTGDNVFVQCKMPKKYTVTYKYFDEEKNEKVIGKSVLRFNQSSETILGGITESDYFREGYNLDKFYLKNDDKILKIESNNYINSTILEFEQSEDIVCYIDYKPKSYQIHIVGYSTNGQPIYTEEKLVIDYTTELTYFSNVHSFLTEIYNTTSYLSKNFLELKSFTFQDDHVIDNEYKMPAHSLEIKANYIVKCYDVDIELKLKDESISLNNADKVSYRYGTNFNFEKDMKDFQYALENGYNTESYKVDEFSFVSYSVLRKNKDDINNIANITELQDLTCLRAISENVKIVINTIKSRFFVDFIEYSFDFDKVAKNYERNEILFEGNSDLGTVNMAAIPLMTDSSKVFGGWKLLDKEKFGDYAYLNYDYKINKNLLTDDIMAYAEWYTMDISPTADQYWDFQLNENDCTATIISYKGTKNNLSIPNNIYYNGKQYKVVKVGNGLSPIIPEESLLYVKKVLIPESVVKISSLAFFGAKNIDIIFQESEKNGELNDECAGEEINNLIIDEFAFAGGYVKDNNVRLNSSSIKSIYLPKRVKEIKEGAFAFNCLLEDININKDNKLYKVESSCALYRIGENGRDLFTYINGSNMSTFTIPQDVIRICDFAITSGITVDKIVDLEKIDIEENSNLKEIGSYAFSGESGLLSVELPSLPNLISLGKGIFYESFSNAIINNQYDLKFRSVVIDINHLNAIPDEMFYKTKFLLAIKLINDDNINEIGNESFSFFGEEYIEKELSSRIYYEDISYTNIRKGAKKFFETYFKDDLYKDVISNIENDGASEFKAKMKECLQGLYFTTNSLTKIGRSNFTDSLMELYISKDDSIKLGNGETIEPLESYAFAYAKIKNIKDMSYNLGVNNETTTTLNENITLHFNELFIKLYSFYEASLYNISIEFKNCIFKNKLGDRSFYKFKIIDTKSDENTCGRYNFTVLVDKNMTYKDDEIEGSTYYKSTILVNNIFSCMSLLKSNLIINFSSTLKTKIESFVFYNIYCNKFEISGVSIMDTNAFANANTNSSLNEINDFSVKSIIFNDCSFDLEEKLELGDGSKTVFRNLMFYELKRLEFLQFKNCKTIIDKYNNKDNNYYASQFGTFKTVASSGSPEVTYDEKINAINIDFTIGNQNANN